MAGVETKNFVDGESFRLFGLECGREDLIFFAEDVGSGDFVGTGNDGNSLGEGAGRLGTEMGEQPLRSLGVEVTAKGFRHIDPPRDGRERMRHRIVDALADRRIRGR